MPEDILISNKLSSYFKTYCIVLFEVRGNILIVECAIAQSMVRVSAVKVFVSKALI